MPMGNTKLKIDGPKVEIGKLKPNLIKKITNFFSGIILGSSGTNDGIIKENEPAKGITYTSRNRREMVELISDINNLSTKKINELNNFRNLNDDGKVDVLKGINLILVKIEFFLRIFSTYNSRIFDGGDYEEAKVTFNSIVPNRLAILEQSLGTNEYFLTNERINNLKEVLKNLVNCLNNNNFSTQNPRIGNNVLPAGIDQVLNYLKKINTELITNASKNLKEGEEGIESINLDLDLDKDLVVRISGDNGEVINF